MDAASTSSPVTSPGTSRLCLQPACKSFWMDPFRTLLREPSVLSTMAAQSIAAAVHQTAPLQGALHSTKLCSPATMASQSSLPAAVRAALSSVASSPDNWNTTLARTSASVNTCAVAGDDRQAKARVFAGGCAALQQAGQVRHCACRSYPSIAFIHRCPLQGGPCKYIRTCGRYNRS